MVLLADPHRGADEPESGVALVDDCVSVAKVFPDHLAVHDLLWDAAVAGCRGAETKKTVRSFFLTWEATAETAPAM